MMRFRFDELKTTQAAAYLLKVAGGTLASMQMIHMLYLVDRKRLLRLGSPLTGSRVICWYLGIIPQDVLNYSIRAGEGTIWSQFITDSRTPHSIRLKQECSTDELSQYECETLESICIAYNGTDAPDISDVIDELPESKPVWTSGPPREVNYEDILRGAGKPESEIEWMHEDAEVRWHFQTQLGFK